MNPRSKGPAVRFRWTGNSFVTEWPMEYGLAITIHQGAALFVDDHPVALESLRISVASPYPDQSVTVTASLPEAGPVALGKYRAAFHSLAVPDVGLILDERRGCPPAAGYHVAHLHLRPETDDDAKTLVRWLCDGASQLR